MEQRLSLVTLGVTDIDRARAFYEALGWSRESPDGEVVFFQACGMIVALWGRDKLAEDSVLSDQGGWGGVTLAYNARSPEEVDAVIAEAHAGRHDRRPGCCTDLLGWLFGHLHRSGRLPLGGGPQSRVDHRGRRLRAPPLSDGVAVLWVQLTFAPAAPG